MMRQGGRQPHSLRQVTIQRRFTNKAPGSVLYQAGETVVLCTASLEPKVPEWMAGRGTGWMTAEYSMLPGSTQPRKKREREKVDGRTTEIQRLIGRSLRAVTDLALLGERTLMVDCDVLQADGGTRTASITGALVAVVDALHSVGFVPGAAYPLRQSVAAVSVGIVNGLPLLDLDYVEDVDAEVDMNVVMTGDHRFVEVQGTGEESTFSKRELEQLVQLAEQGVQELTGIQAAALGPAWPFRQIGNETVA